MRLLKSGDELRLTEECVVVSVELKRRVGRT